MKSELREDLPKELHELFEKELAKWPMPPDRQTEHAFRLAIQHFFLKGFDVAMATGGMKPKRTIATFHNSNNHIGFFVISNDGRMFRWLGEETGWQPLPNLPQG